MAGTVFFRREEPHPSRNGHCFNVPSDFKDRLTGLVGKEIPGSEFTYLVQAIAIAYAENEVRTKDRATRKDALAQLKAMCRLKDDDALLHALRGCDQMTFMAVQQEQMNIISEHLWRNGVFVDSNGIEYQLTVPRISLGIYRDGHELMPPYLPMGFNGVRDAVIAALKTLEAVDKDTDPDRCSATYRMPIHPKKKPGNVSKPYQLELARACLDLWRRCGNEGEAWRTNGTKKRSKLVDMADVVFTAAGMTLGDSRLVTLLKASN